jgi:hypothetical protein
MSTAASAASIVMPSEVAELEPYFVSGLIGSPANV